MPYKTVIRLIVVARNPTNGFPARLLGRLQFVSNSHGQKPRHKRDNSSDPRLWWYHLIAGLPLDSALTRIPRSANPYGPESTYVEAGEPPLWPTPPRPEKWRRRDPSRPLLRLARVPQKRGFCRRFDGSSTGGAPLNQARSGSAKMQDIGFLFDDIIIWDRKQEYNNLRPLGHPSVFRTNKVHEYILIFQKPRSSAD